MTVRVLTQEGNFLNDLGDVLRLFLGDVRVTQEDLPEAEMTLSHSVVEENGIRTDVWTDGTHASAVRSPAPSGSPLELKRLRKRAAKNGLYRLMREKTGIRPPWGALTGIRPTRLLYEGLDAGLTRGEAAERLVREFDVSPDRAALLSEIADMQSGILLPEEDEFDLYIGIPFCTTRCSYCSFSSGEIGDGRLVGPYVEALIREIGLCAEMIRARGLRLRAGYVGGGTPTAIPCGELERILEAAQTAFPGAREWTVEAGRPDTIDREKLSMLRYRGIGRISVNPQTFNDATLERIGRAHTAADTLRAFELARHEGFDDINMDLITSLPGETPEDFARTLDTVIGLAPESVTVHTLAIKHSSRLHEQMVIAGDDGSSRVTGGTAADMTGEARRRLTENGWRPYYLYRQKYMAGNQENVGYARPGRACLYNIGNMEETASVLAVGAGAITKWLYHGEDRETPADREAPEPARFSSLRLRIERAPNVRSIEQYIQRVEEMADRKRSLILPGEGGAS